MEEVDISRHAYKRAKQRMRWRPSVLDKMANIAYDKGMSHGETKGSLNKYIYKVWNKNKGINVIRIYGEHIYLFSNNLLVTIYRLDNKLIKWTKI